MRAGRSHAGRGDAPGDPDAGVVAAWYGDDLAYTESLLVSPKILRKHFFPWMEELAGIAHAAGMPFIMHSDGRLWQVLDDLIALGVNALHPIEAKAMDIYDLKRRYGQKLAIFGNVDLGYTLDRGHGDAGGDPRRSAASRSRNWRLVAATAWHQAQG